jgi:hypothetical protein
VDIRQVLNCIGIHSISLTGIFLCVLRQKIALVEDRLLVSVGESQCFTENREPYIHSDQVATL